MDYKKLVTCLKEKILASNKVIITGHTNVDIDAIASALGLYNIVEALGKDACIVVDDSPLLMEPGAKKVIENISVYTEVCSKNDLGPIDDHTLLIMTDVNQYDRISLDASLFNDIIIIDHHSISESTIQTPNLFIDIELSSACEIIGKLLAIFNIPLSHEKIYSYLYAGIILDTNKFTKNTKAATHIIATYLLEHGANVNLANSLLVQDFAADRRMQNLISYANTKTLKVIRAMDHDNPNTIYLHSDIARAADYLLTFDNDASFVMAYVKENLVSLKARSKGEINVGKIMDYYGGGGNVCSAAASIETSDILDVYKDLDDRLNLDFPSKVRYLIK